MTEALEITPELLHSHAEAVRAVARRVLADEDAAEDVLQDTWLTALEHPPARTHAVGGWLRTVARTLALKRLRSEERRRRREVRGARPESLEQETLDPEERARVLRAVTDAVLGLSEPYRSTVLQRYFESTKPAEIARREGVSVAAVKSRLQRAFVRLRGRLRGELDREDTPWTRSLALFVGASLPPVAPPLPSGSESAAAANGAGGTSVTTATGGTALPLTAVMATKFKLLSVAGVVGLLGVLWMRDPAAPPAPVAPQATPPATSPIESAQLAFTQEQAEYGASDSEREAVEAVDPEAERVWPAAVVPGPALPYMLAGIVVDQNDLPVAGAQIYLGPLMHPLNAVAETDDSGRFQVRWLGRRASMEVAFCARPSGRGSGVLQTLTLTKGVAHQIRTTVETDNERVVYLGGLSALREVSLQSTEDYAEQQEDEVVTGVAISALPGVWSGPLDEAPNAVVDSRGITHFVGLETGFGCPGLGIDLAALNQLEYLPTLFESELAFNLDSSVQRIASVHYALEFAEYTELAVVDDQDDSLVRIEGSLIDPLGIPIANALIARLDSNGQSMADTRTDEDGNFVLDDLAPGEIRLRAGGGNHGLAGATFAAAPGNVLHWAPALDRGLEIRGRLVDEAGEPLDGWQVVAYSKDPARPWSDATRSAPTGFFAIPNAPAGAVRLLVSRPDAGGPEKVYEDVWPGTEQAPFRIATEELAPGSLALTVVDFEDQPVEHATVRLWREDMGIGFYAQRKDGEPGFAKGELPPGSYRLEIGSRTHGWIQLPGVWIGPGEDVDLGRIALPAPARLDLRLLAEGPVDLGELTIEVWREHGDVRSRAREISGTSPPPLELPPGDYVIASCNDRAAEAASVSLSSGGGRALQLEIGAKDIGIGELEYDLQSLEERLAELEQGRQSCVLCHSSVETP